MTSPATQYVLWVTRDDVGEVTDSVLRERAGVEGAILEVRRTVLRGWAMAKIPAGARDEWGTTRRAVINVGVNELPPEGRVYLVNMM